MGLVRGRLVRPDLRPIFRVLMTGAPKSRTRLEDGAVSPEDVPPTRITVCLGVFCSKAQPAIALLWRQMNFFFPVIVRESHCVGLPSDDVWGHT